MKLLLLWLALLCMQHSRSAHAALDDDFVSLPLEFGLQAPARLVFNQRDLSACLRDTTAQECVLKGPIKINEESWRAQFADSDGAAVLAQQDGPITIRSGSCSNCPSTADVADGTYSRQALDWNSLTGVLALKPGAKLRLINLRLDNFAEKPAYVYSSGTPFLAIGVGMSVFPTFNLAPNTTIVGLNLSATFVNPSDTGDCARYVMQSRNFLTQSYGAENIVPYGPTSTLIIGPIRSTVPIRNGSTGTPVGSALSVYKHLTLQCLEKPVEAIPETFGAGKLAAAIAVPVAVVALLALALLLWLRKRRVRRAKQQSLPGPAGPPGKHQSQVLLLSDVDLERPPSRDLMGCIGIGLGCQQAIRDQQVVLQDDSLSAHSTSQPTGGFAYTPASLSAVALQHHNAHTMVSSNSQLTAPSNAPQEVTRSTATTVHIPGAAQVPVHQQSPSTSQQIGPATSLPSSAAGFTQLPVNSTLTNSSLQPPTPQGSLRSGHRGMHTLSTCPSWHSHDTCSQASGLGRARGPRGGADTTTAVLKARSDAAVLKDLKLGPLLGQGCFGRVYRGRWKATPVAVKIIEHYSSREGVGSSRGNRVSAGREMLFATSISHPNLVTTYHISTLSTTQRAAAATSLLPDTRPSPSNTSASGAGSRRSSNSSTASDQSQPDLLETYIVMEFCPKGSLERALKQGRFRRHDGQPDMTAIYKALLDTASGLDYLHSIGVVHGDLKTANVLLSSLGKGSARDSKGMACKITDFGLSRVLDVNAGHVSTGTHGTIVYMPKELLLSGRMTQATDIYSFGLMMWELITSQHIMEFEEGVCVGQMFYMIAYQDWRPQLPEGCPPGYADLMVSCWQEDPEQRPTAQQLLRRLQMLQGHARQESVAARRAHASEVSRGHATDGGASEPSTADPSRGSSAQLQDLNFMCYSTGGTDAGVQISDAADSFAADSTSGRSKRSPCDQKAAARSFAGSSSQIPAGLDGQTMNQMPQMQSAAATCSSLDSEGPFALMLHARGSTCDSGTAADHEQEQTQQQHGVHDGYEAPAAPEAPAEAPAAPAGVTAPAYASSDSLLAKVKTSPRDTAGLSDFNVRNQQEVPAGGMLLYSTAPGPVYRAGSSTGLSLESPALSQMTGYSSLRLRTTSSEHTHDGAGWITQSGGQQTADPYLDGVIRRLRSSSEMTDSQMQAMQALHSVTALQAQQQQQVQQQQPVPVLSAPPPLPVVQGLTSPRPVQYYEAQDTAQQNLGSSSRPHFTTVGPTLGSEALQPSGLGQPFQEAASGTSRWYVAPYVCGQEFAGCLPQLEGPGDVDGLSAWISMQPYIDALAAVDAARAATPAAMESGGV